METRVFSSSTVDPADSLVNRSGLPAAGLIAGSLGAVTLAIWFLMIDMVQGRPLFTPTMLGTLFFKGGEGLAGLDRLPITADVVLGFTFLHWMVFVLLGGIAAWLLESAERNPSVGFGILLLFMLFEFGFVALVTLFAKPILQELTWPTVLVGNLLAAGAMGGYLWRQYSYVTIRP